MEQIHITLPDGTIQEVPKGTTPADIARKISPRLADAALVARVAQPASGKDAPQKNGEGELIDLRRPLDHDVSLQILTEKDPDALFVFRHSSATSPSPRKISPKSKKRCASSRRRTSRTSASSFPSRKLWISTRRAIRFSNASWSKKRPASRWSPSTPPENSSTSAAARTSLRPSASRRSSS